jgi:hypothetical protein
MARARGLIPEASFLWVKARAGTRIRAAEKRRMVAEKKRFTVSMSGRGIIVYGWIVEKIRRVSVRPRGS